MYLRTVCIEVIQCLFSDLSLDRTIQALEKESTRKILSEEAQLPSEQNIRLATFISQTRTE